MKPMMPNTKPTFRGASTNQSKAVKVVVDKLFVDKGLRLGKGTSRRSRLHPRQRRVGC